jgi:uncharacterized protein YggE
MERVVTAVTTVGIAEKDVQTSQFSIVPYHKPDPHGREQPEVAGYRVTNEVQLKVRALTSLGRVLDELVGAGANQMHGISFSVAEPSAPLDDARKKAMADAKRRAELYAQAAEVKLGRVLLIQEQPPSVPRPQMLRFALRAEADAAVPVAPGENKFHASITVTYSIE